MELDIFSQKMTMHGVPVAIFISLPTSLKMEDIMQLSLQLQEVQLLIQEEQT